MSDQERLMLRFSLSPNRFFSVFGPARPFTAGEISIMRRAIEILFEVLDTDAPPDPQDAPQRDPLDSGATQQPEPPLGATTPVTAAPTDSDATPRLSAAPDGPDTAHD